MNKEELQFKNKIILIYGFGISGKACFKYLKRNNNTFIYDDNSKLIPNKYKKQFLNIKKISKYNFNHIVISPGIDLNKCSLKKYLKKNKEKIISELDIFYLENKNNLKITITGTNGKSTTSKLLYEIIKNHKKDVRIVGNIGKYLEIIGNSGNSEYIELLKRFLHHSVDYISEAAQWSICELKKNA